MSKLSKMVKETKNGRKMVHKMRTLQKVSRNGKIFGVEFIKKNGEKRTMSCRLGVTSHLRGGHNTTAHLNKYLTVYSQNDKGYRNINVSTIRSIRGLGQEFRF